MGLKIDIDTGNEAFQGIAGEHCGELLIEIARKLAQGVKAGAIFDGNGNKVGSYELRHTDANGDPVVVNIVMSDETDEGERYRWEVEGEPDRDGVVAVFETPEDAEQDARDTLGAMNIERFAYDNMG